MDGFLDPGLIGNWILLRHRYIPAGGCRGRSFTPFGGERSLRAAKSVRIVSSSRDAAASDFASDAVDRIYPRNYPSSSYSACSPIILRHRWKCDDFLACEKLLLREARKIFPERDFLERRFTINCTLTYRNFLLEMYFLHHASAVFIAA